MLNCHFFWGRGVENHYCLLVSKILTTGVSNMGIFFHVWHLICTLSPGHIAQHDKFLFMCCISSLLFDPLYHIQLFPNFYVGRIAWMILRNTQFWHRNVCNHVPGSLLTPWVRWHRCYQKYSITLCTTLPLACSNPEIFYSSKNIFTLHHKLNSPLFLLNHWNPLNVGAVHNPKMNIQLQILIT